ncbi:N-acetyltransferase DgcN [Vibrio tritonius]|uniref:N-acetyltransferase DgcN n=1 Tax=Vibrio tritonius TaxID=1435069 RepID=UPI000838CC68|nr:N-acetyltransferase DgcN [Vibrio tritonius]
MQIPQPYLLFLGDVADPLSAKTARGIHAWRPDSCVGQMHLEGCHVSLGLPELTPFQAKEQGAKTFVLGTANAGGYIPEHWMTVIKDAIEAGLNIASGLHQKLVDVPELVALAKQHNVALFDVRHHQPALKVGSGLPRGGKRVLTVGTDCAVGKMYTSLALEAAMQKLGMKAEFRATGQTGILVAGAGIPIDAVVSDFISGAAEWISPTNDADHWDVIEGQGSLFHPSYAGVSLGLLHGSQPDYLVMCHEMGRPHTRHLPHHPLVEMEDCVYLNLYNARLTNPNVQLAGISVNTSNYPEEEAKAYLAQLTEKFQVPATDSVRFGIDSIAEFLLHQVN